MNEEITVGEFMDWCKEGPQRAGVSGQNPHRGQLDGINTPGIVLERGGEVLRTPKRSVGRAYVDAIPYIRGKWIPMGDADLNSHSIKGQIEQTLLNLESEIVDVVILISVLEDLAEPQFVIQLCGGCSEARGCCW